MALQGTLSDFGLADIFQLIGIQRKTGVLTLENDAEVVTVKFLEGQVAGADTRTHRLEDQLGRVLVRTGRITEAQLREALEIQKNTLQRLGYILAHSGSIGQEDLREALQVQVCQMVYRLFRWRDGRYHFEPREELDYDRDHFTPVSAETILMEGARMVDEWPIIERRIRSDKMVFRKTAAGAAIEAPVESLADEDVEFDFEFEGTTAGQRESDKEEIRLSPEEREVLRMVDGRSRVRDLVDRSPLGEFDVHRSLYELLTRNLIEEVSQRPAAAGAREDRRGALVLVRVVAVLLMGLSFLAVATMDSNPTTPWRVGTEADEATARLRSYASRMRMERIERAIRVFYLHTGRMPERLDLLAQRGYLAPRDLVDPWGRPYDYHLAEGGYRLIGRDARGESSPELVVGRRFSAAQRMLLEGAARN